MDWRMIASDFTWNGSWRDIYVLETSEADWQAVWDVLRAWEPPAVFIVDGVVEPMPACVEAVLAFRDQQSALLSFYVGPVRLNCHFFSQDEIEFDLDPREVTGPVKAGTLADFLKLLGETTGKSVVLTEENAKEILIARYAAESGHVVWAAAPDFA